MTRTKKSTTEPIRVNENDTKSRRDVFGGADEFIATRQENVNQSPIDFYLFAHLLMGHISFLFFFYLCGFTAFWSFCSSVLFGIFWEPFENYVVYSFGAKFDDRKDSVVNSLFDMLFVAIGASVTYSIPDLFVNLVVILVEFSLWVAFFVTMTDKKKFKF